MDLLVIVLAGLTTWLSRASFIAAGANWEPRPFVERIIQNARHAAIAALATTALLAGGDGDPLAIPAAWLVAGAAAAFVAYRYRSIGWTIGIAMITLWSATFVQGTTTL